MSEQIEHKAKLYQSLGVFAQAKKFYQELYNITEDLDDRTFYKSRIRFLENLRQDHYSLSIGEAFFPVVDEATGIISIPKVKITPKDKITNHFSYLEEKWSKVSPFISSFLDNYLNNKHPNIYVYNWGLDKVLPEIILPTTLVEERNIIGMIEGDSIELALFVGGISYLLNIKIDETFVFSASLDENAADINLRKVGGVSSKLTGVEEELGDQALLVTALQEELENPQLKKYHKVEDVVEHSFESNIEEAANIINPKKFDCIRLEYPLKKVKSTSNEDFLLAEFNHSYIQQNKFIGMAKYFETVASKLKNKENGVIIDGLLPNVLGPILMTHLKNHTGNFIAFLLDRKVTNEMEICSAVIVSLGKNNTEHEIGEVIYYEI